MIHIVLSLSFSLLASISSPSEQGKSRLRGHWVKYVHTNAQDTAAALRKSGITNLLLFIYTGENQLRSTRVEEEDRDPPLSTSLTPLSLNGQMTVTFQLFTWPI